MAFAVGVSDLNRWSRIVSSGLNVGSWARWVIFKFCLVTIEGFLSVLQVVMCERSVVFPLPLTPINAILSPGSMPKEMFSKRVLMPCVQLRFCTESMLIVA